MRDRADMSWGRVGRVLSRSPVTLKVRLSLMVMMGSEVVVRVVSFLVAAVERMSVRSAFPSSTLSAMRWALRTLSA